MDLDSLLQGLARLPDADRTQVHLALGLFAMLLGAALPWPRPRRAAPRAQPALRLRRPGEVRPEPGRVLRR